MDRLAKKCVLASGLLHGTLVLVLLVGPAFLRSNETVETKQVIDFIPFKTLQQDITGGGNPNVAQVVPPPAAQARPEARPQPQPVKPEPQPERRPDPTPVKPKPVSEARPEPKAEPRNDKPDPDSLEAKPKPHKPVVNLKPVVRKSGSSTSAAEAAAQRAQERARERAATERLSRNLDNVINSIREGASGSVQISDLRGPGGGGIPVAGFNQALISAYMRAWLVPADVAKLNVKVVAVITLRRDGTVISSRIERASGNSDLNESVREALNKVSYVAPFPDNVKDTQKTFWLEFDPRARAMMG